MNKKFFVSLFALIFVFNSFSAAFAQAKLAKTKAVVSQNNQLVCAFAEFRCGL